MSTAVFVLAVGYGWDDAISDEDQCRLDLDMMLSKTMYAGGRRRVCTSDTPLEASSVAGFSLALIGRRASVGGSVGLADWPRVLSVVDKPPGRVWIDFIRQALEDSQSIVAEPVTGSLVSPTLFSCRDAICTTRYSIYWIVCDTDWSCRLDIRCCCRNTLSVGPWMLMGSR